MLSFRTRGARDLIKVFAKVAVFSAMRVASMRRMLSARVLLSTTVLLFCAANARPCLAQSTESSDSAFRNAIEQGELLARKADWNGASQYFFKAASLDPEQELGYYDLGVAYLHLKQFEKARIAEERAA